MRTRIFNNFANYSKDFRDDFAVLWRLPEQVLMGLVPLIPRLAKTRTVGEKKVAMDNAVAELGGSPADVLNALNLLLFIYGQWNPIRDTAESFLKDLGDLSLVPEEKVELAKPFLIEFLSAVEKDNTYRLEKIFAAQLLPCYEGCSTVVDFRAVIRHPFGSGLEDDLEHYDPKCIGFIPVVVIELKRDSGDPLSFVFQCEEDSLEMLIEGLNAALRDLKSARESLPRGDK